MTHAERPSAAATALPVDLDEAAHRCLVAGFDGTTTVPPTLKRLIDRGLGGVILFTRNVRDAEQVRRLTDELRSLRADLLVATSDAGLHPWQARLRATLAARRPDAVLVDTGLPEGGALCSYGRGKVNLRAVAEVLAGP